MKSPKLLIVTTVPDTLATILRHQPRFLAEALEDSLAVELATSPGSSCKDVIRTEGVPLHTVSMARGIAPLKDFISLLAMTWLLRRLRPHIVHSFTEKAGIVTMLAAWACRVPVRIHTFTGLVFPTEKGFRRRILIAVDWLICACATIVVPEGKGVKHDLQRYAITKKALDVIGHGSIAGVDTAYFNPHLSDVIADSKTLAQQLNLPPDAFLFCFVGRLNRDKGIAELLAAFAEMPEKAHLLLVGSLDSSAPICVQDQTTIRAHPRIHSVGFLSDIRPALRISNALVLASYREGFPNAVLQACAMEVPVIATDINGSNEIIEAGINGWLVPIRSAPALRDAMRDAMETPASALETMGVAARGRIEARFERAHHWQNILAFYGKAQGQLTSFHGRRL
jgi:glycosyltransferase involved in cell wall biosynthesis